MVINIKLYDPLIDEYYPITISDEVIGRNKEKCSIILNHISGVNEEISHVSRVHCKLLVKELTDLVDLNKTQPYSLLNVVDLNSRNGTYVNGRPASKDEKHPTPLKNGDVLSLGPYELKVIIERKENDK